MNTQHFIRQYNKYVMPTYSRTPLILSKGKGARVWDINRREYLDFFPGWAVSGIGHCHPKVVAAIKSQTGKILHVSNNYYNELQGKLAAKIIRHSFPGKCFFCNSGAEANEAAIKLARYYGKAKKRYEIITMKGSFHGRTLTTLSATGQRKYKKGFEPLPRGFKQVEFNNSAALKKAVNKRTAAIMLEPIQGEGGINVAKRKYLKAVKKLCQQKDILLIFDEVQTGMGRTGAMFCFSTYGIRPDLMTLAKTLGGGFPIGALVADERVADVLQPGTHASTFGGSPLACAAALAVFRAIEEENLVNKALRKGKYLRDKLTALKKKHKVIKEIRGRALMLGIELKVPGTPVVEACFKRRLLINCTQGNILRLMPCLNVKKSQIDKAISILDESLNRMEL
jgi:predicted acetylornithine/succinylornithine family transaminase